MKKVSKKSKAQTPSEDRLKESKGSKAARKDDENTEDGRMDFGGLPDRDLKKNLGGCG